MLPSTANNRKCMTGQSDRLGPTIVAANERSVLATEMKCNLRGSVEEGWISLFPFLLRPVSFIITKHG